MIVPTNDEYPAMSFKLNLLNVSAPDIKFHHVSDLQMHSQLSFVEPQSNARVTLTVVKFDEKSIAVRDEEYQRYVLRPLCEIDINDDCVTMLYSVMIGERVHIVGFYQPL